MLDFLFYTTISIISHSMIILGVILITENSYHNNKFLYFYSSEKNDVIEDFLFLNHLYQCNN